MLLFLFFLPRCSSSASGSAKILFNFFFISLGCEIRKLNVLN